jgi:DNA-binding NarL/FixJ family response regulator
MRRPKLLLAEDHRLVAEGLKLLLSPEYDVVGIVGDGAKVLAAVGELKPDVLLLDLSLPNRAGLDLIPELVLQHPTIRILAVTMHRDPAVLEMALRLGAAGFVPKEVNTQELKTAVAEVVAGRRYVSPLVPRRSHRGAVSDPLGFNRLTPRQQQIMRLIAHGLSSEQIAKALRVSLWTVHFHRKNIRRNLGLHSDHEMCRYAMLVELAEDSSPIQHVGEPAASASLADRLPPTDLNVESPRTRNG